MRRIKLNARGQLQVIGLQLLLLFAVAVLTECAQVGMVVKRPDGVVTQRHGQERGIEREPFPEGLELPRVDNAEFLIRNADGRYTLYYDTAHVQAAWVAHVLTRGDVLSDNSDRGGFRADPVVRAKGWPYAVDADYRGSGYDRGHLLPSADRDGSQAENDATFLFSNISPQHPAFNRTTWRLLEEGVRDMAKKFDTLYVVTGGIMNGGECIGKNRITVPSHFFKVLLGWNGEKYIAAGFVIPNSREALKRWHDYAVAVDSVEELSGYDFFHNLPDRYQEPAERYYNDEEWKW